MIPLRKLVRTLRRKEMLIRSSSIKTISWSIESST